MISRRTLLGGATATAALSLAGCASTKFRSYEGPAVTGVAVSKAPRPMYLLSGNTALRGFDIQLRGDPVRPKRMEGDGRTPEGAYWIDRRNPNSQYHLSIGILYPNTQDLAFAKAVVVSPGGEIFIHGTPREKRRDSADWTAGCIAVTDREMEDIYAMVGEGTPIHIDP